MLPFHRLSNSEREDLLEILVGLPKNPYHDYSDFADSVQDLVDQGAVPRFFIELCREIREERRAEKTYAHLIANMPVDQDAMPRSLACFSSSAV
jgi:L-asparagine oxygenase